MPFGAFAELPWNCEVIWAQPATLFESNTAREGLVHINMTNMHVCCSMWLSFWEFILMSLSLYRWLIIPHTTSKGKMEWPSWLMTSLFSASTAVAIPDNQLYQYNINSHRVTCPGILSGYQNDTTKCSLTLMLIYWVYFLLGFQLLNSHLIFSELNTKW